MTTSTPVPPPVGRRRWGPWLVGAVLVAIVAWLGFSGVSDALVYYLTPTELAARGDAAIGQSIRLGGLVLPGSVSGSATDLTFVLTDGDMQVTVHSSVAPTSSFREGAGAVVEGALRPDGVFEAEEVLVKHDENYVAPSEGELPPR
jgi:cytochrome c-type biogenesis protein CcmE